MRREFISIPVALFFISIPEKIQAGSCSAAKLCCQGRDSGCVIQQDSPNAIVESIRDKPCYCDHACLKLADCCDDFKETCGVVDCRVTEWTKWTICDNGCGSGTQRRSRKIESPERNGGKHCPRLDQVRSCRSYEACQPDYHSQSHDRGVTIFSLFKADSKNSTEAVVKNRSFNRSASCVALTIVRASRACGRISTPLVEGFLGSRICVERQDVGKFERLVGIGRWKLLDDFQTAGDVTSPICHGKWIGDSKFPIDCNDPGCVGSPILVARFDENLQRSRRNIRKDNTSKPNRRTSRRGRRKGRRRRKSRRSMIDLSIS